MQQLLDRIIVGTATKLMLLRHRNTVRWYRKILGTRPNLCPPETSNEKFLWRKIFDHNPFFTICCDKMASKEWVKAQCPDLPIPKVMWQGRSAKDIPDEFFNTPCYIKANAGSHQNIKVDEEGVSREEVEQKVNDWLSEIYGTSVSEWGYKNATQSIFVEELITDKNDKPVVNVNAYCFDGSPDYVFCIIGGHANTRKCSFFSPDGTQVDIHPAGTTPIDAEWIPPKAFYKALKYAETLSKGNDFIRCDFLCRDDGIWFGELTIYTMSGFGSFQNPEHGQRLYENWDIAKSWLLTTPQKGWKRIYAQSLMRILKAQS